MTFAQIASSCMLIGLVCSPFVDCIALAWRAVHRPGRPSLLEGVKLGMSRMIGHLLLALCVPGSVITLMIVFARSWDDNSRVNLLPLLFLCGTALGAFMISSRGPSRRTGYGTVTVRQNLVRS